MTFTRSDQQLFWLPIRIWDDLASHGSACATRKLSTRNKRSSIMSTKKKLPANRLPNADEYQLKAALIVQLKRLMPERGITQTEAAKLVGVMISACTTGIVHPEGRHR
ncbi:helix-turn-helix domain-containing protein [Bradyrhizobium canariense]|uniref:helix-turn-helix domain-containing protein n=1 Tax=Bradyrhizobium canariense TaxID=255045 RepID=UPI001F0B0BA8|nr:helix-turn-helix domain-containing protein [Bradyrhizobium canariense]